ncbi:MAG: acyl-CoA synthetase FdrA [Thermoanaerobaculia bacterium]
MTRVVRCEIRSGAYADSIVLMQLQSALTRLPGVIDAGVIMGTPVNLDLLASNDLLPESAAAAGADDMVVVVKAESDEAATDALAQIDTLLARRSTAGDQEHRPRSLAAAIKARPDSNWVLISVPGRWAAGVAREAVDLGRHVFLYSDNVPLEDEIQLKQEAAAKGLLFLGPDCGTTIVNGVGLGFANRVRRGAIGLVGASGTGLQAVTSRIHELGGGISHALGTGGRDLTAEVGGITAHETLDLLARDPDTRVIVLVSKPPAPRVAAGLLSAARATGKPVVVHFFDFVPPARSLDNLHFTTSLSRAAELAVELLESGTEPASKAEIADREHHPGRLRGLFAGGSLAVEAQEGLRPFLTPLHSNVPVSGVERLTDPTRSQGHTILDLGSDELTVGRLHPMMDQQLRIDRLHQEAADPDVGLLLLDVVLGYGAHPDPAAELVPAIEEIRRRREVEIVAVVIGTDEDAQEISSQIERLTAAGARVFRTITEATTYISRVLAARRPTGGTPVALEVLSSPMVAINVGLETFYDSLTGQGVQAIQLEWRPPAGGDAQLISILERMKK